MDLSIHLPALCQKSDSLSKKKICLSKFYFLLVFFFSHSDEYLCHANRQRVPSTMYPDSPRRVLHLPFASSTIDDPTRSFAIRSTSL